MILGGDDEELMKTGRPVIVMATKLSRDASMGQNSKVKKWYSVSSMLSII